MAHGEYGGGSDSAFPSGRPSRRFGSTEHLATEAIAAYVDGELRMGAHMRAAQHLALCPECAAEVDAQQQARGALRRSGEIAMPRSLFGALSQIPMGEFPRCPSESPFGPEAQASFTTESKRWSLRRRK